MTDRTAEPTTHDLIETAVRASVALIRAADAIEPDPVQRAADIEQEIQWLIRHVRVGDDIARRRTPSVLRTAGAADIRQALDEAKIATIEGRGASGVTVRWWTISGFAERLAAVIEKGEPL